VPETRALARLRYAPNQDAKIARCRLELQRRFWAAVRFGRILEPPPDRGCVRRTSRSKCGCAKSLNDPKTRGLAVSLRLVLRTQPRSVSARFWWWYQDAPRHGGRVWFSLPAFPGLTKVRAFLLCGGRACQRMSRG